VNCSLDHDVILTSAAERKELDNRISNQLASSRLLRNIAVGERKKGWMGPVPARPGRENGKSNVRLRSGEVARRVVRRRQEEEARLSLSSRFIGVKS